jgi:hypothetical protein
VNAPEDREGAPEPDASATAFRPAEPDPLWQRAIPVAKELPGYRTPTARRDLLAGVTVAALAIPAAMAYAELAGLPAVAGLYALLLPTVAYAFLGSSRQLIVGRRARCPRSWRRPCLLSPPPAAPRPSSSRVRWRCSSPRAS